MENITELVGVQGPFHCTPCEHLIESTKAMRITIFPFEGGRPTKLYFHRSCWITFMQAGNSYIEEA